tara:strand:- start:507 stop:650 length:144 start_codon:yes stop_codon:yes gene_type:complete
MIAVAPIGVVSLGWRGFEFGFLLECQMVGTDRRVYHKRPAQKLALYR